MDQELIPGGLRGTLVVYPFTSVTTLFTSDGSRSTFLTSFTFSFTPFTLTDTPPEDLTGPKMTKDKKIVSNDEDIKDIYIYHERSAINTLSKDLVNYRKTKPQK